MKKYIIIKSKSSIKQYEEILFEIFSSFITVDKYEVDIENNTITLYYNHNIIVSLEEIVDNIIEDIYEDIILYESYIYDNFEDLLRDKTYVLNYINSISYYENRYMNDKLILENKLTNIDEGVNKLVLKKYFNNQEMLKTVKVFLEKDQNVTLASKSLFLHRNTLNQRLDKFYEETNFNVKKFKDAFLIYHLIK